MPSTQQRQDKLHEGTQLNYGFGMACKLWSRGGLPKGHDRPGATKLKFYPLSEKWYASDRGRSVERYVGTYRNWNSLQLTGTLRKRC